MVFRSLGLLLVRRGGLMLVLWELFLLGGFMSWFSTRCPHRLFPFLAAV